MTENNTTSQYVIYILECSNGCYYTGYTTDMERRYQEHLDGSSKCKYTRSFPPIKIAVCWVIQSNNISLALKIEKIIKRLSKQEKTTLIKQPNTLKDMIICNCNDNIIKEINLNEYKL